MTQRREELVRALWCAAKAAGGTLRIGGSILEDFPWPDAFVTITRDAQFGDLVVSAHGERVTPRTEDGQ